MRYLGIKNWSEFQHYKDRNPPWIKLHVALLNDYEFGRLPDTTKAHLMLIWLFASQNGGRIPDDPKFLQTRLGLDKLPDLQALEDQGFLIAEQNASEPLAQRKHGASEPLALARSREERREEVEKKNRAFAEFWLAYPRRVAKPAALKAWAKLKEGDYATLMAALEIAKRSPQWTDGGGRYIPHPATWLNDERWKDEQQSLSLESAPAAPRTIDLGNCPCGAPATAKVGGKPRCNLHIRGLEAVA